MITSIKKRDGRIVPFDQEKIEQAIEKSFMASGSQKSQETAQELAGVVVQEIERDENLPAVPSVEQVQDVELVENTVVQVLEENPQSVADWRGGKEKTFSFLVGQTMRAMKGKADPAAVNRLWKERLSR